MALKTPLQGVAQAVGYFSSAGRQLSSLGILDVSHSGGNVVLRLSMALFCIGLTLQALSNTVDPYRCGALIRHGSWPPYSRPSADATTAYEQLEALQQEGREPPPARPFDKWEPAGCRMCEYSRDDIRDCLGGKRLLFVGDSSTRVLFFATLTRLEHEAAEWLLRTTFTEANPRHDLSIESESVQLDFIWDPWLNSTAFQTEIDRMRPGSSVETEYPWPPPKPAMMVVGAVGLWAARNAGDIYFEKFRTATDHAALAMEDFVRPSTGQDESPTNYVFLSPVTIPRYEMLPPGRAEALSPGRIKLMNDYLSGLPNAVQSHILTVYNEMASQIPEAYEDTGLHVAASVAERWIDIPLNARCNGLLARRGPSNGKSLSLAYKTTCCVMYPDQVRGQIALWYGLCAVIAAPVILSLVKGRVVSSYLPYSFLGLAVLYCYVADRSHAFPKTEKHYSGSWLYFTFIVSGAGFIASRRHIHPREELTELKTKSTLQVDFLPRHVSDEWKGLMQAAFLLLSYQKASEIPAVVRWAEFFTNAYLFLSAFGHASYFLKSGDFSFRRVASVLFRLNILPCLLTLMLDGRESGTQNSVFHLYHFQRLVSFWFLVTYITLRLGFHINQSHPDFLLMLVCISSAVVVFIILLPGQYGFFEIVSRAGHFCCDAKWNADDMRRAVCLYWCAPFWGMAVAVIARRAALTRDRMVLWLCAGHPTLAPIRHTSWLDQLLMTVLYPNEFTALIQPMVVIFCSIFFLVFAGIATFSPIADESSHPYATNAAVVSFAVMRNFHSKLRATYMLWPAALGTFALELLVLHNHILLSGNGTGRLRLLSSYRPPTEGSGLTDSLADVKNFALQCLEVVSISTIYLVVSWRSHLSTRMMSSALFGEDSERKDTEATTTIATGLTALDALVGNGVSDEEHYELPQYGHGFSTPPRDAEGRLILRKSGARLQVACLLLLLWLFSKFYV